MDMGGLTREIAPLKHKKIVESKISDKVYVNLHSVNDDESLTGYHFFHHIIGLSNLKKCKHKHSLLYNNDYSDEGKSR